MSALEINHGCFVKTCFTSDLIGETVCALLLACSLALILNTKAFVKKICWWSVTLALKVA